MESFSPIQTKKRPILTATGRPESPLSIAAKFLARNYGEILKDHKFRKGVATHADAVKFAGARYVRVKIPNRAEPLYGVLQFCALPETAFGPASRFHVVQIPEETRAAASDGKVAMVWEEVQWVNVNNNNSVQTWVNWLLWLSDRPLEK